MNSGPSECHTYVVAWWWYVMLRDAFPSQHGSLEVNVFELNSEICTDREKSDWFAYRARALFAWFDFYIIMMCVWKKCTSVS